MRLKKLGKQSSKARGNNQVSISRVGRRGAVAAMLLATLLVEDVIADPPQPTGDLLSHPDAAAAAPAPAQPVADKVSAPPPVEQASLAAVTDRSAFDTYLDRLMRAGYSGPWGIEVLNAAHRHGLPLAEVVQRAYSTKRAQFGA